MLLFRGNKRSEAPGWSGAGTPAWQSRATGGFAGTGAISSGRSRSGGPRDRRQPTVRILVANRKGGCGKSTIATNLAAAYASGGLRTGLADLDRLRCSLDWLAERPAHVAPVLALDWTRGMRRPPADLDRLVIDAPAGTPAREVAAMLSAVDVVVVPVLPSAFDEGSVEPFLERLLAARRIRNGSARIGVIRNRYRATTRAGGRLDSFFGGLPCTDLGGLPDRTVYAEAAAYGLSLFDLPGKRLEALRQDWAPLLKFIERMPATAAA